MVWGGGFRVAGPQRLIVDLGFGVLTIGFRVWGFGGSSNPVRLTAMATLLTSKLPFNRRPDRTQKHHQESPSSNKVFPTYNKSAPQDSRLETLNPKALNPANAQP